MDILVRIKGAYYITQVMIFILLFSSNFSKKLTLNEW